MPQYRLAARQDAERTDAQAAASTARALRDVQRSTNYILCAVLFAAALFFAGMSARLASTTMRRMLLAIGVCVFLATVVWLVTFPVSFSV
jgi:predicted phage tail protein